MNFSTFYCLCDTIMGPCDVFLYVCVCVCTCVCVRVRLLAFAFVCVLYDLLLAPLQW